MTKKEIIDILNELKIIVNEYNAIKFESTDKQKELHTKISELYGRVQEYYVDATGIKNIEVPVAGSKLKSKYNNYFEAGYLSGRTFHSNQGYTELISVIGIIKSKKNISNKKIRNSAFTRNEIIGIVTILLVIVGGSFLFGKYIGENRFDQKKIDLTDENKILKQDNESLMKSLNNAMDSIVTLNKERIYLLSQAPDLELVQKISISYLTPKSIFNGQVFITADSYRKKLEFKGILGLDKDIKGDFKNNTIVIEKGDRFFIKLENNDIWIINVLNLISGVDIELLKK
ncbi:MAG: hypothetical protein HPY60_10750 [Candidatus Methanofastidiosum sp.]|nr:hypothetical protein [Methanofastidiosum sp.]